MTPPIRLVVTDVDGTLVTPDKVLTDAAVTAVRRLGDAGIRFAVTSGRPPRGMQMLVEPLALAEPIGGYTGGLMVRPDMGVLQERSLPASMVPSIVEQLDRFSLGVWCYQGNDWFVRDAEGLHVDQEAATVQFPPIVRATFDGLTDDIVKIVGVSDDRDAIAAAMAATSSAFGHDVSASTSQPYYLDVTHPEANKGCVIGYLSAALGIATEEIATIGDGANDALMFARSGLSIAMGNASEEVRRSAHEVSMSNDEDGFAYAIEHFVLDA